MKTLIIVDLQYDFMPGGALGVPKGDEIIPVILSMLPFFDHVIATQDWHPERHVSFASTHGKQVGENIQIDQVSQILWPVHCVQNTQGAALATELPRDKIEQIFYKGIDPAIDSYSAFFDNAHYRSTGLGKYLKEHHLNELYFAGLATDYCVLYSVIDALKLGFDVTVVRDACRAINLDSNDELKALDQMKEKGAKIVESSSFYQL